MNYSAQITGTGSAFPDRIVSNDDLVQRLAADGIETSDEWIVERTGIRQRRMSDMSRPEEWNSGLALRAAQQALEMAGKSPEEVDQILYATCTPDQPIPAAACFLQHKLGANRAYAMDINAACSGFTYALTLASQSVQAGGVKTSLVIGADTLTPITNWKDRGSCILFGDGAGAVLVEQAPAESQSSVLGSYLGSDGRMSDLIEIPQGGSREMVTPEIIAQAGNKVHLKGREVFKEAVKTFVKCTDQVLERAQLKREDVDWFIPHQANLRIIEAVGKRLDFPEEKVLVNIDRFANTSSATVPSVLDEAVRDGRIQKGQVILMAVFGGGLTYGSLLLRW